MRKNLPITSVLVLVCTIMLSGCTGPRLEVLSEKLDETSVKTAGQDDYAVTYAVRLRNKGMAGRVRAMAQLHHPEGMFYAEEILSLKPDEDKMIEFTFTEPTVLGSAIQGMDGKTQMRAVFRYESIQ